MLNKKFSDIVVVGLFVVVFAVIVLIRVVVINHYDERITGLETENIQLTSSILQIARVVENNKDGQVLSFGELYQAIPNTFRRDYLGYDMLAILEEANITTDPAMKRLLVVSNAPVLASSLPQGSPYRTLAQSFDLYAITIRFTLDETMQEYHDFIALLEAHPQTFLLRTVSFNYQFVDEVIVELDIYAIYAKQ